jgi:ribosomal protein S18 acetylase RimI-like enzyme
MIRIRRAFPTDAEVISEIDVDAFGEDSWNSQTVKNELARGAGFIAEDVGGVAGFVLTRTEDDVVDITKIAVRTARRREGIAKALLLRATDHDLRSILAVKFDNVAAITLYLSMGFIPISYTGEHAILEQIEV